MILKLKFRQELACVLRYICVQLPPEFLTRGSAPGHRWGHRPKTPHCGNESLCFSLQSWVRNDVCTAPKLLGDQEPKAHNPRIHNIGSQILY